MSMTTLLISGDVMIARDSDQMGKPVLLSKQGLPDGLGEGMGNRQRLDL
jgi:hypothetical protein